MTNPIPLPDGEQLILTVDRALPEEQCERCKGKGLLLDDVPPYYGTTAIVDCWACHGTGCVKKRVRGWFLVNAGVADDEINTEYETYKLGEYGYWGDSKDEIIGKIVAAWKGKTLPDEIAKNLIETETK